ncbi:hypothetical protein WMY93_029951 [Mugilogobius chulae]|uniref:Chemokine interleukin-8-like domain-containing protein n=1 Tax=Mugilogobius chulae TaxID=88201 RepID=A0AAW0MQW9_9GOBI
MTRLSQAFGSGFDLPGSALVVECAGRGGDIQAGRSHCEPLAGGQSRPTVQTLERALLALSCSEAAAVPEKLASCCTTVSTNRITEPILGLLPQRKSGECVLAYIVQTEKNLYCIYPKVAWIKPYVEAERLKQAKARAATAPPKKSLFTILSSSSAPPTTTTITSTTFKPTSDSSDKSSTAPPASTTVSSSSSSTFDLLTSTTVTPLPKPRQTSPALPPAAPPLIF